MDFTNPIYLQRGNDRQRSAYQTLNNLALFSHLADFQPVLTGTVPLGIDIPDSDLDICCEVYQPQSFMQTVSNRYSRLPGFEVHPTINNNILTTVIQFRHGQWLIELFGHPLPTIQQPAYRHMVVEHRILQLANANFWEGIKELKRKGIKTEPAFAQ
ncbi:MAG: DUF4269 domain-containing protein [Cyclobacteriaceae bacterium]